jgi:hypothetical protein
MTFSEWLNRQSDASRLEACERVLARFRAAADTDPAFTSGVGTVVWGLLSSSPGDDARALLADMRSRAGGLGRERLDNLSSRLLHATAIKGDVDCEAGKLVSSWFNTIGLCSGPAPFNSRALHLSRAYETTFDSLGRLMMRADATQPATVEQAAA